MQGATDVAMRTTKGDSDQPHPDIWKPYAKDLNWKGGISKHDDIPWTVVTPENAQQRLDARK